MPETTTPHRLTTPLRIPAAWDALLDIEDLETIEPFPGKPPLDRDEDRHLVDPTPFRDDQREVTVKEGDYVVTCRISSGTTNYFAEWTVHDLRRAPALRGGGHAIDERSEVYGTWQDNIAHDLPEAGDVVTLELSTGETIEVPIQRI